MDGNFSGLGAQILIGFSSPRGLPLSKQWHGHVTTIYKDAVLSDQRRAFRPGHHFYRYWQLCSSIDNRARVLPQSSVTFRPTSRRIALHSLCLPSRPLSGAHSRIPLERLFRMASPVAKLIRLLSLRHLSPLHKNTFFRVGQRHLQKSADSPVRGATANHLPQRSTTSFPCLRRFSDRALLRTLCQSTSCHKALMRDPNLLRILPLDLSLPDDPLRSH